MIILIVAIFFAYLLGSIPTSFLLARAMKDIDIREHGSGNVGATNALRILGKGPAVIALLTDMLKGVIAVTFLSSFFYQYSAVIDVESFRILLGLAAICGHIWTVFLKFKGGKGVATSTGVLMILCPIPLGIVLLIWFLVVILTKYVSLGSIISSICLPIVVAFMGGSLKLVMFTITLCLISSYKHKSNITRLIKGEESKIGPRVKYNREVFR